MLMDLGGELCRQSLILSEYVVRVLHSGAHVLDSLMVVGMALDILVAYGRKPREDAAPTKAMAARYTVRRERTEHAFVITLLTSMGF